MYGYYYLMFATFPILYTETYGFSTGISGLVSALYSLLRFCVV